MRWLFRWLKKNFRDTPAHDHADRIEKTAEVYLHDEWFEHFQADLKRWAER